MVKLDIIIIPEGIKVRVGEFGGEGGGGGGASYHFCAKQLNTTSYLKIIKCTGKMSRFKIGYIMSKRCPRLYIVSLALLMPALIFILTLKITAKSTV